jgi:hypothetical protein
MYTLWRASHPPVGERIDFANTYKPWLKGERLKYEHLFRAQAKVGTNEGLGH